LFYTAQILIILILIEIMSKKNRNKGQGGGQNNSTDQVQNVHDVDLDKSRYSGDNRLSTNEGSTIADSANLEGKKYDSDDMGSSKSVLSRNYFIRLF